jgi:hypothetical protein
MHLAGYEPYPARGGICVGRQVNAHHHTANRRRVLGFRGGEAVKKLDQYAAKKAVPLYGRYIAIEGRAMSHY